MSFRTVVVTDQAKLNYKNRFLVVKKGIDEKYVHLSEIDTIIVDSISVSISNYLLKEIVNYKINLILCDEKHNPYGEIKSLYGAHNSSKKIINQSKWKTTKKDELWSCIIKNKIINQLQLLKKIKSENAELLVDYLKEVKVGDKTNREGHAAKVYFNSLFGKKFSRNNDNSVNSALNYGYAILLSTINKEVINNGYLTQLGIHHKNEYNEFNLSCDLMEPFRVIIDNFVYYNQNKEFNKDYKLNIINIFNNYFKYKNKQYTLKDVIKFYVKNTLEYLDDNKEYEEFIYEG